MGSIPIGSAKKYIAPFLVRFIFSVISGIEHTEILDIFIFWSILFSTGYKKDKKMRKYLKHVDIEYERTIAMLIGNYQQHAINYSDDNSTAFIGDFYLRKQFVEGVNFSRSTFRDYNAGYNAYHIGYNDHRMKNEIITYDENPILFEVIDRLDSNCYKEYKKRQKREQLIANIKSFPKQIIKGLGRQK